MIPIQCKTVTASIIRNSVTYFTSSTLFNYLALTPTTQDTPDWVHLQQMLLHFGKQVPFPHILEFIMQIPCCENNLSTEKYNLWCSNVSFSKTKVQLMKCLVRRLAGGFTWRFISQWYSRRTTQYTALTRLFTIWCFFLQAGSWFTNCLICWRVS